MLRFHDRTPQKRPLMWATPDVEPRSSRPQQAATRKPHPLRSQFLAVPFGYGSKLNHQEFTRRFPIFAGATHSHSSFKTGLSSDPPLKVSSFEGNPTTKPTKRIQQAKGISPLNTKRIEKAKEPDGWEPPRKESPKIPVGFSGENSAAPRRARRRTSAAGPPAAPWRRRPAGSSWRSSGPTSARPPGPNGPHGYGPKMRA